MRLSVKVKPGSKKPGVEKHEDGSLTVRVREPATDGKANAGVIAALAEYFHVRKSQIVILHGHAARTKIIEVGG